MFLIFPPPLSPYKSPDIRHYSSTMVFKVMSWPLSSFWVRMETHRFWELLNAVRRLVGIYYRLQFCRYLFKYCTIFAPSVNKTYHTSLFGIMCISFLDYISVCVYWQRNYSVIFKRYNVLCILQLKYEYAQILYYKKEINNIVVVLKHSYLTMWFNIINLLSFCFR